MPVFVIFTHINDVNKLLTASVNNKNSDFAVISANRAFVPVLKDQFETFNRSQCCALHFDGKVTHLLTFR